VTNPLFWLLLSFLLVSVSLTAVLVVLVPAIRELGRAARSVEQLCNTLDRELPSTLESIRLTSVEIAELTDDVNAGVQNASRVAQHVDESMHQVREQAQRVHIGTRSFMAGVNAAFVTFMQPQATGDRSSSTRPRLSPKSDKDSRTPPPPPDHSPDRAAEFTAPTANGEKPLSHSSARFEEASDNGADASLASPPQKALKDTEPSPETPSS
jgi:uncharacterized protein YoxC